MSAPLHTHTNPMLECSVGTCVRMYIRTYTDAFTPARQANALRAPHCPTHRWHTTCHRWPAVCATVHQSNNKHHTMQTQYTTSIRTYMHMCSLHMQQTVLVVHAYICIYIRTYIHMQLSAFSDMTLFFVHTQLCPTTRVIECYVYWLEQGRKLAVHPQSTTRPAVSNQAQSLCKQLCFWRVGKCNMNSKSVTHIRSDTYVRTGCSTNNLHWKTRMLPYIRCAIFCSAYIPTWVRAFVYGLYVGICSVLQFSNHPDIHYPCVTWAMCYEQTLHMHKCTQAQAHPDMSMYVHAHRQGQLAVQEVSTCINACFHFQTYTYICTYIDK